MQTQTGIVLDDVSQPSFSALANEQTDGERVEVLPEPQSTLSGRNAAGGFDILNRTAGIRDKDCKYSLEFFVNNVTNRHYYASVGRDCLSPAYALSASYARDSFRYIGGRFSLHF